MEISIFLGFLVMGMFFGSFYNVVAYRVPKGESILFPSSHCPNCNHKLKPWELIPVFSFLLQKGKCSSCNKKISWFYPISELMCGLLFGLSYLSFGLSLELIIALTFVSMLIIVILSDYYYMIIEDVVLIVFGLMLLLEMILIYDFNYALQALLSGLISFGIMFLLKLFGDFIFKKESLGGGDIKLMFIIGMLLGWKMSIMTIFLSSFIALPVSLVVLKTNKNHEIPYGPFLSFASLIIYFCHIDMKMIFDFLNFL